MHLLLTISDNNLSCPDSSLNREVLNWHENLIPILQPAHSPQLNPVVRLWQFLKAQLKGENFASLTDLKARIQQLLDELMPEQVASLTSYDFILEALFYAAI